MLVTTQYYLWVTNRPYVHEKALGEFDPILHISKTEPDPKELENVFCIYTDLVDIPSIADALYVPEFAIEFVAELIDKVEFSTVAIPENLELMKGYINTTSPCVSFIPDYNGKCVYSIDSVRIKELYDECDVILYKVDAIYSRTDEDEQLEPIDDDAYLNKWLNEFYVHKYERAGLIDINHTCIGYQGPVIMGKMNGKTLNALYSLNNKIN